MAAAHPLTFAGHDWLVPAAPALFWPRHRALIVADLHLEKASSYAAGGQFLPPYDSAATLDALGPLARALGAAAIWCLGDSFHDPAANGRMPAAAAAALRRLTSAHAVTFVAGNHDGLSGDCWGGAVADELVVDDVVLRHAADPADPRPEISGHYHPKLRLRGGGGARRCFAVSASRMILPAFGSMAGGMDVGDAVIAAQMRGPYRALVPTPDNLLWFPPGGDDAKISQRRGTMRHIG